jgi:hypothetical protein
MFIMPLFFSLLALITHSTFLKRVKYSCKQTVQTLKKMKKIREQFLVQAMNKSIAETEKIDLIDF